MIGVRGAPELRMYVHCQFHQASGSFVVPDHACKPFVEVQSPFWGPHLFTTCVAFIAPPQPYARSHPYVLLDHAHDDVVAATCHYTTGTAVEQTRCVHRAVFSLLAIPSYILEQSICVDALFSHYCDSWHSQSLSCASAIDAVYTTPPPHFLSVLPHPRPILDTPHDTVVGYTFTVHA